MFPFRAPVSPHARKARGRQDTAAAPRAPAPLGDGAVRVAASIGYYRDALRSALRTNLVLAGIALLCLACALTAVLLREPPVYFGMGQDMKLLPLVPLSEPILNESALKNWVGEAVSAAFNLDYLNWRKQLSDARQYFTRTAFGRFAATLDGEGHLPLIRQHRALMHAVIQGTPVLTRSGVVSGVLLWEFELPLLISYETSRGRIASNSVVVIVQVQRVPATDYPRGVALSSVVTTTRVGGEER